MTGLIFLDTVVKICLECGEPFGREGRTSSNFARQRFCSRVCGAKSAAERRDHTNINNPRWQGGSTEHPLYAIWCDMKARCNRPTHQRYTAYGGRGIRVCRRWQEDFWAFVEDVGPRPGAKSISGRHIYSLDRIDNDGDYEPSNCRWATPSEQMLNRRRHGFESRSRNEKGQFK